MYSKFWRYFLQKFARYQLSDLLFLFVFASFYISWYHFSQVFRNSFIIWKKYFRHKFSFLTDLLWVNSKNPLSATKVFCWCYLKVLKMTLGLTIPLNAPLLPCAFFSFPDLQATDNYKDLYLKMKLGRYIWLPISWVKSLQFFNGGGSTTCYRGLTRLCKLSKMESLAPKSSILHNSISQKWDQFSK